MEGSHRKKAGLDAWAAGLFDGEGCIDLRQHSRKKAYGLRIRVSLKYPRPLWLLVSRYGGGIHKTKWQDGRAGWVWQLHTQREVGIALRAWLPWLAEKGPQAKVGLRFLEMASRRERRKVYSLSEQRRCAAWATKLKDLKRHQT